MNGYNDITTEPADDEEFALACGYDVITKEELLGLFHPHSSPYENYSSSSPPPPTSSPSFFPRGFHFMANSKRSGSITSASSSGVSSMKMAKPMSSCSLSSQGTDMSDEGYSLGIPESYHSHDGHDDHDDELDHLSVENLWYMIQQKRHLHEMEDELRFAHLLTMEQHSNGNKLTAWFLNLLHLPEKLRQTAADKHRFNINNMPQEIRDELKHIYVY